MAFQYVDFAELRAADGLRAIYVGGVPSPWGEAAKGVLHMKGLDHQASRLDYSDKAMREWSPPLSAPVIVNGEEAPVDKARDIVELAERLAPDPALLPEAHRDDILAFIDDLANEGGLGWDRRVQLVHWALQGKGGFREQVAGYLAAKYGHSEDAGEAASARVIDSLGALAARLNASASGYYFGEALTAADIYAAAFMALFSPLPQDQCAMAAPAREAFSLLDDATAAAVDPILLAHRDRIYAEYLETPLSL
ncbi:MAG: hypothetical protein AAFN79_16570 [Pseudomonadota bacterium]